MRKVISGIMKLHKYLLYDFTISQMYTDSIVNEDYRKKANVYIIWVCIVNSCEVQKPQFSLYLNLDS